MAKQELNLSVDFTNKDYNVNEGFEIMQGGGYYNITCTLTNNGDPMTGSATTVKLYVVTSDSLDYIKSVSFVNTYGLLTTNVISFSDEDLYKLFRTKGNCQLVFVANNFSSIPFNYYVIGNPAFAFVTPPSNNGSSNGDSNISAPLPNIPGNDDATSTI